MEIYISYEGLKRVRDDIEKMRYSIKENKEKYINMIEQIEDEEFYERDIYNIKTLLESIKEVNEDAEGIISNISKHVLEGVENLEEVMNNDPFSES